MADSAHLKIVGILTIGFTLASLLAYFTQRVRLSPILGYLLAGYVIGPYFPGFIADHELAEQLAEVGVMLMMFGVGMHFKWQDLASVKSVAIPGALGQTLIATIVATLIVHQISGSWEFGIIIGLAIGVASTVVLVRVLADNNLLHTLQGHIAVGWLIVEDILTVAVLVLLPTIVALLTGSAISVQEVLMNVVLVLIKFVLLVVIMFTLGKKVVSYVLFKIAQTRSPELFTLTVLALIFLIATISAFVFGASIALGAFIAGMVIGQTAMRHQASAYSLPMRDTFVVIFFLSVGMLFNPVAIIQNFALFLSILTIVLVIKPLAAYLIVILMRYPKVVALSVAFALAQIGEFSFILAEEAGKFNIFPDVGYDVIVACALISISVNPLLFKMLNHWIQRMDKLDISSIKPSLLDIPESLPKALVVGFGILGSNIVTHLEELGYHPIIIEKDVDKVNKIKEEQREVLYGDASLPNILEMAQPDSAKLLIITIPDLSATFNIIQFVSERYPNIKMIAYAQNLEQYRILNDMGIDAVCYEKEMSKVFDQFLLNNTSA